MPSKILVRSALLGALLFCLPSRADFYLLDFRANGVAVTQSQGGQVFSGELNWSPEVDLGLGLGLRGELGMGLFKNLFGDKYLETHYQLFATYEIVDPIAVEAGAGFETWSGNGGTHPIVSTNLVIYLPLFIDIAFAGVSYYFLPGDPAQEYKAGIGVSF